jgi:hypothetical protein
MSKSGVISKAKIYKKKCNGLTFTSLRTGAYDTRYRYINKRKIINAEIVIDTLITGG